MVWTVISIVSFSVYAVSTNKTMREKIDNAIRKRRKKKKKRNVSND